MAQRLGDRRRGKHAIYLSFDLELGSRMQSFQTGAFFHHDFSRKQLVFLIKDRAEGSAGAQLLSPFSPSFLPIAANVHLDLV